MSSSRRKDFLLRRKFSEVEKLKKIKKFLTIYLLCNKQFSGFRRFNSRFFFFYNKDKLHRRNSKIRIKNICVYTNRTRSVSKYFSLSRLSQKELMQFGYIPGYVSAVW